MIIYKRYMAISCTTIQLFHTDRRPREIPLNDALRFADLLSKSSYLPTADRNHLWGQEIAILLRLLYPNDEAVKYYLGSVLSAVGNYRGLRSKTIDGFNSKDFFDNIYYEYDKEEHLIPGKQGYLQTTEGNVVHYGYIEKFIEKLGERFNIREIAFDRWGAVQMVQNLEGMGFTVVPFGQGFKDMSPPTKELMKLTLEQKIAHGGHPILRWMMDNIFIRTDPAGNIKADKEKSTEKIDGAIATIMGLDRAIRCGADTSASVYDERGLLFL